MKRPPKPGERAAYDNRYLGRESILCPKCGRYGRGPITHENGDAFVRHMQKKERPDGAAPFEGVQTKRAIYCKISSQGRAI